MSVKRTYEIITSIKNLTFERKILKANAETVVDKLCDWALELKTMERDGMCFESMFGRDYETEQKIEMLEKELKQLREKNHKMSVEILENKKLMSETVEAISIAQDNAKSVINVKARYEAALLSVKVERDSLKNETMKLQKELSVANKKLINQLLK